MSHFVEHSMCELNDTVVSIGGNGCQNLGSGRDGWAVNTCVVSLFQLKRNTKTIYWWGQYSSHVGQRETGRCDTGGARSLGVHTWAVAVGCEKN
ncbi:hypothetical protein BHE74_00052735 [Ensete ventricosum]|nr:hypothetical protein BHE74_00052735 [Ensete ventricosum]